DAGVEATPATAELRGDVAVGGPDAAADVTGAAGGPALARALEDDGGELRVGLRLGVDLAQHRLLASEDRRRQASFRRLGLLQRRELGLGLGLAADRLVAQGLGRL